MPTSARMQAGYSGRMWACAPTAIRKMLHTGKPEKPFGLRPSQSPPAAETAPPAGEPRRLRRFLSCFSIHGIEKLHNYSSFIIQYSLFIIDSKAPFPGASDTGDGSVCHPAGCGSKGRRLNNPGCDLPAPGVTHRTVPCVAPLRPVLRLYENPQKSAKNACKD